MGWQLVPTGIGWREFSRTVEQGKFECSNPKCKGRKEPQQTYDLKNGRNWFTVLFIPIIPLNSTGSWAKCTSCKTVHPLSAVSARATRAAAPAPARQAAPPSAPSVTPAPPPPTAAPASAAQQLAAPSSPARSGAPSAQVPTPPARTPVTSSPSTLSSVPSAATASASQTLSGIPVEAWLLFAGMLVYLIVDLDEVYVLGAAGATWRKVVVLAGLVAAAVFGFGRRIMAGAVAVGSALFLLLHGAQVLVSGRGGWHQLPLLLADVALGMGTYRCVSDFGTQPDRDDLRKLQPAVLAVAGVAGLFGLLMFRDWLADSFRYVFLETAHWVGLAVVLAVLITKIGTRPAVLSATLAAAYSAFSLPSLEQFGGIRYVVMLALLALAGIAGFVFVKLGEDAKPSAELAGAVQPGVGATASSASVAPSAASVGLPAAPPAQPPADVAPHVSSGGLIAAVPGANATPVAPQPEPSPPPAPPLASPAGRLDLAWADGRPLTVDNVVVIGRDPVAAETDGPHELVPVPGDGLVSKTHLAIGRAADGSLWAEDRHSTNGVRIGASLLPPGGRVPLKPGDEIRFGDQVMRVVESPNAGRQWPDIANWAKF